MQEEGEQQTHTELPKARDAQKKKKKERNTQETALSAPACSQTQDEV